MADITAKEKEWANGDVISGADLGWNVIQMLGSVTTSVSVSGVGYANCGSIHIGAGVVDRYVEVVAIPFLNTITNTGGASSNTSARIQFGESNYSYVTSTGMSSGAIVATSRDTPMFSRYTPSAGELSAGFSIYLQGKCTPSASGSPAVGLRYMEVWGC